MKRQFAQNSAQVFNRGKRLRFPIGIATTTQLSADQRADAQSSEEKLLSAFKGLSETLRGVATADHAKEANQADETKPPTQNTSNRGSDKPADGPRVKAEGPDAEPPAPPVKLHPPVLPTIGIKMPRGPDMVDRKPVGILKNEKDQDTRGSLPHDDPASQKPKPEPIPRTAGTLPTVKREEAFRHPFGPHGATQHPINLTGHGIGTGTLQSMAEAKEEDDVDFDGPFDGELDFTAGKVSMMFDLNKLIAFYPNNLI